MINALSLLFLFFYPGCRGQLDPPPSYDNETYAPYNYYDPHMPRCRTGTECKETTLGRSVCEVYADCSELLAIDSEVPTIASLLSIRTSYFKNLTYSDLKNFTSLKTLELKYGDLIHVAPGSFQAQTRLQELNMEENRINEIVPGAFDGLRSVTSLKICYNELERISSGSFRGLSTLNELDLGFNSLTVMEDGAFVGAPMLQKLYLNHNNISYIASGAFKGLSMLQELNIHSNNLRHVPSSALRVLPRISILELGKNLVQYIAKQSFKGMKTLRVLWLDGCRIASVAKRAFNNKKLVLLSLEHNLLSRLPNLGRMTKIEKLYLDGNPWLCDCRSTTMVRWLKRKRFTNRTIECHGPPARRGRDMLSFSNDELCQLIEPEPIPAPPSADSFSTTRIGIFTDESEDRILFTYPGLPNDIFRTPAETDHGSGYSETFLTRILQNPDTPSTTSPGVAEPRPSHTSTDASTETPLNTREPPLSNQKDRVDFSVIVTIATVVAIAFAIVVAMVAWKLSLRGKCGKQHDFRREVELAVSKSKGEKGARLHRHKNEKRKRPHGLKEQNGRAVVTTTTSLQSDENSNKALSNNHGEVAADSSDVGEKANSNGKVHVDEEQV